MSELEIKTSVHPKTKKEHKKGIVKDATLLYVRVDNPDTTLTQEEKYSVTGLVDEATGDQFKKTFPKNSCTMIKTKDIKEKFKIDPPFPDDVIHYQIKLKARTTLARDNPEAGLSAGDPLPYDSPFRPKVKKDGQDITMETKIGNGSRGDIHFNIIDKQGFGSSATLHEVEVKDLIPYENLNRHPARSQVQNAGNKTPTPTKPSETKKDEFDGLF